MVDKLEKPKSRLIRLFYLLPGLIVAGWIVGGALMIWARA